MITKGGFAHHAGRKWIGFLLKFGLVALLLGFLIQKGFISVKDTGRAFSRLDLIVPAVFLLFVNTVLGAVRWQWLLRPQGIEIPFARTLELTLVGNFFNVALPGAVSGDFVKAFYIGRDLQGHRGRAFGSILFDRVAGLSALVLVSATTLFWGYESLGNYSVSPGIRVSVAATAISVVLFYAYLFLVQEHADPVLRGLKALEQRVAKAGSLVRIYEGIRHYHRHRRVVVKVLVLSILIHLIVGWACLQFAHALGETQLGLLPVYMVAPLGLLVTAIPVMPAGVGTGHAAFLYLFSLIGSDRGADVFTLLAMVNLALGGVGGVVYLKFKGKDAPPGQLAS